MKKILHIVHFFLIGVPLGVLLYLGVSFIYLFKKSYLILPFVFFFSCQPDQLPPSGCPKTFVINEKKTRQHVLIQKDTVNRITTCTEPTNRRDTIYFWDYYVISYSIR